MKKFKKNDDSFICQNCNKIVSKLGYTSRDHCPFCLYSKHVDVNPGDRQNNCLGLLKPIDIEKYKDKYKIIYTCSRCGEKRKNVIATDDDYNEILKLTQKKE